MSSSPAEPLDGAVAALAQRLCGEPVVAAETCGGSGNNRVYRIRTRNETFAMKCYGAAEAQRDRLGHEFDGLRFLSASGIELVPAALAVDRTARCALYAWIEGAAPVDHGPADVGAVLDLLQALHAARTSDGAAALPDATEAVLRLADLEDQIERRLTRLAEVAPAEPELAAFLDEELRPEAARRLARLAEWDVRTPLAREHRTLSPSDFGFHNALRRADGSLAFIDFEYFGWDDPVKPAADFLWHPAMHLSAAERLAYVDGTSALYGADPAFSRRLAVCFPLYGLRWSLIILNEFLPPLWARRSFAGKGGDWEAAKRDQLRKARTKLAAVRSYREGHIA